MAAKTFTEEQKQILSKNPNVESVENTRIIYTEAFKTYYVKNYLEGKKPTEIFIEAGFDPSILGNKRIERASARWRKLYAEGQLNIEKTVENKKIKEDDKMSNEEPAKKKRGRPRKQVVEEVKATEVIVEPKKKRGRPRKQVSTETVISQEIVTKEKAPKIKRKRVNKIAAMAQNIKLAENEVKEQVKTDEQSVQEPVKKRRGRPKKNVEPTVEVKPVEEVAPKKRRGRPRKQVVVPVEEVTVESKVEKIPVEEVAPVVTETKTVETAEKSMETTVNENPVADLVKAINKLTREVNSLKRLLAGKKRVNY